MIRNETIRKAKTNATTIIDRMNLTPKDRKMMTEQARNGHPGTLVALAMRGKQLGII